MAEAAQNNEKQPIFNLERIYIKNASLEQPRAPDTFLAKDAPEIEVKLGLGNKKIDDIYYEATLTATVTATLPDKRVLFLAEANIAGIFRMENLPAEDIDPVLNITCPNIMFPYAREMISDLITRAGFPPVYLAPINFEAMYAQAKAQEQQPAGNA